MSNDINHSTDCILIKLYNFLKLISEKEKNKEKVWKKIGGSIIDKAKLSKNILYISYYKVLSNTEK